MTFAAEQRYKAQLIDDAFALHGITLPNVTEVYTDGTTQHYRNKVEFSWYSDTDAISGADTLDLAFFRRGSKGKITLDTCSLLPESMMQLARDVRDTLRAAHVSAGQLKTLLIRSNRTGRCVWQLYIKDRNLDLSRSDLDKVGEGGEVIYSDPRSPASVITERLASYGETTLSDTILDVPFRYATEGFFQINLPVYEQALRDMQQWVAPERQTIDMYSGVGSIGLTIGGAGVTLVELNEHAVREMRQNIRALGRDATAILAASENALQYITGDATIIVDPPRAGLHASVIERLLEQQPPRIIYLSCNPVTQARDVALLAARYAIVSHRGYNFFPRTPHIEHSVVLDAR